MSEADARAWVKNSNRWFTEGDIVDATGCGKREAHRALQGLASHGFKFLVRRSARGKLYKVAGRRG
jgi:DNA-binding IclR family transcriptional regulator